MNFDKCKDELPFIKTDRDPSCLPDTIEEWFINLRNEVDSAQTSERLMCIMDMCKDTERKCRSNPFTKRFLPRAYSDVMEAAKKKLSSIKSEELITFSSGRKSNSSLDAIEREFNIEKSRRMPWL